eukprot:Skav213286  [mRNA]  locus=scaffold2236:78191:78950:- [translate_table: standard]
MVELKNGETYSGVLASCDGFMNLHMRDIVCTSRDGERFWKIPECYVRGNSIKYLRLPDEAAALDFCLHIISCSIEQVGGNIYLTFIVVNQAFLGYPYGNQHVSSAIYGALNFFRQVIDMVKDEPQSRKDLRPGRSFPCGNRFAVMTSHQSVLLFVGGHLEHTSD